MQIVDNELHYQAREELGSNIFRKGLTEKTFSEHCGNIWWAGLTQKIKMVNSERGCLCATQKTSCDDDTYESMND